MFAKKKIKHYSSVFSAVIYSFWPDNNTSVLQIQWQILISVHDRQQQIKSVGETKVLWLHCSLCVPTDAPAGLIVTVRIGSTSDAWRRFTSPSFTPNTSACKEELTGVCFHQKRDPLCLRTADVTNAASRHLGLTTLSVTPTATQQRTPSLASTPFNKVSTHTRLWTYSSTEGRVIATLRPPAGRTADGMIRNAPEAAVGGR